jgi:hypothetical protein
LQLPGEHHQTIASAILQSRQEGWEKEFNRRIRVCWLGGGPRNNTRMKKIMTKAENFDNPLGDYLRKITPARPKNL